jgi:hypothetical protein
MTDEGSTKETKADSKSVDLRVLCHKQTVFLLDSLKQYADVSAPSWRAP